jgi:hypothetical protein
VGARQDIPPENYEYKYVPRHHTEYDPPTPRGGGGALDPSRVTVARPASATPRPVVHPHPHPTAPRTPNPPPLSLPLTVPLTTHSLPPKAAPHTAQPLPIFSLLHKALVEEAAADQVRPSSKHRRGFGRSFAAHTVPDSTLTLAHAALSELPLSLPLSQAELQGDDDEHRESISKPVDEVPVTQTYEQAAVEASAAEVKRMQDEEEALDAAEVLLHLPPVSTKRFSGRFVLSQCAPVRPPRKLAIG